MCSLDFLVMKGELRMHEKIETTIENIDMDFFCADLDGDEYIFANREENYALLAKEFEVSPKLIEAIADSMKFMAEKIAEGVAQDLRDVWKRLI